MCVHGCMHVHMSTSMRACEHACTCTWLCARAHVHMYTCALCTRMYVCARVHASGDREGTWWPRARQNNGYAGVWVGRAARPRPRGRGCRGCRGFWPVEPRACRGAWFHLPCFTACEPATGVTFLSRMCRDGPQGPRVGRAGSQRRQAGPGFCGREQQEGGGHVVLSPAPRCCCFSIKPELTEPGSMLF